MPATSPRLSITLSQETHDAVARLSAIQRRPIATIVREFLDTAAPTIDQIAASMEAMEAAQAAARTELACSLSEVAEELEPHLRGILGHLRAMADLGGDDPASLGGPGKHVTPLGAADGDEPPLPGFLDRQDAQADAPRTEVHQPARSARTSKRGEGAKPLRKHQGAKRPHAEPLQRQPLTPGL